MPQLSIVIPVYNERQTIAGVLPQVVQALPQIDREIIIVDDCSRDGTREWLVQNLSHARQRYRALAVDERGDLMLTPAATATEPACVFRVLFHQQNQGKGGALRTGLAAAGGEVIVIQDADLEYDPADWRRMWPLIAERKVADVVFGSRFFGEPQRSLFFHHFLANKLISFSFNLLYNQTISDVEVCYKMFTRQVLDTLRLTSNDFGFEIEFSAQVARARRWRIYQVGISYYGRTYQEGKKINWKDGLKALWYLVKFRF